MKSTLDIIEEKLQALIEGGFQFLPRADIQGVLAKHLVAALQESCIPNEDGSYLAPSLFIIHLNPDNYYIWQTQRELLNRMAKILLEAAVEEKIHFNAQPIITLEEHRDLPENEFFITTETPTGIQGETAAIKINVSEEKTSRPLSAFIIINGSEVLPLRQSVINLGRRLDNHVVLSDPRVSRKHAQLRSSKGSYVIFDLNSTGGTYVNGKRITQQVLKPGDVISLAGVPIIYGEEIADEMGNTSEINSAPDPGEENGNSSENAPRVEK